MSIHPKSELPPAHPAAWPLLLEGERKLDRKALGEAVAFATARESSWPRSFYYPDGRYVGIVEWNEKGPWSEIVGPVRPREGASGIVLVGGKVAAEWGDTSRADMTFSVAKSYLAILAGVAVGDGIIGDIDEPVARTVPGPYFAGTHNAQITWRHLLQQSSEWQGELWGKSDQVDHYRQVGATADNSRKGDQRALMPPGSFYEYNDVRVNLLAYCLMMRFGRPLPDVLRERIMDPIGASRGWEWHGYSTSWVDVGGVRMQSVSGGAHWGGGMFISARDHARVGLLIGQRGHWGDRQLLPESYIDAMLAPSPTNPKYGYLWWLNRAGAASPHAPETAVYAMGAGNNIIWVDFESDVVAVLRWIDKAAFGGFLELLMKAIKA
jgi:CubicO group peptidase (beta-lactamase class C family)